MVAKRERLLIVIAAAVLFTLLAWHSLRRPPEKTSYAGKSLSYWLVQLTDADDHVKREEAALAVQHIGTNAIPILLQMLPSEESSFKTKFLAFRQGWYNPFAFILFNEPYDASERAEAGFGELGPSAAAAVPELIKILEENHSRESLRLSAMALGTIGPDAKMAVPALLRAAVSANTTDHFNQFKALSEIHSAPEIVVPVLIEIISNSFVDRMDAVAAVGEFQSDAKSAVPALVALLNDPSIKTNDNSAHGWPYLSDRHRVEHALQKIDPETYAQIVSNVGPALTR